jgi:hypothetical protein
MIYLILNKRKDSDVFWGKVSVADKMKVQMIGGVLLI